MRSWLTGGLVLSILCLLILGVTLWRLKRAPAAEAPVAGPRLKPIPHDEQAWQEKRWLPAENARLELPASNTLSAPRVAREPAVISPDSDELPPLPKPPTGPGHASLTSLLRVTAQSFPSQVIQLHQQTIQTFVNAPGFGSMRGGTVFQQMPGTTVVVFPMPVWQMPIWSLTDLDGARPPIPQDLRVLHTEVMDRYGQSAAAAAFRQAFPGGPHELFDPLARPMPQPAKRWELKNVDLVGLLMHHGPVVYRSDAIPQMRQLERLPTRPIDIFEYMGLEALDKGEEVYLSKLGDTIRVLGAVRAREDCLSCHTENKRGDLLGAFSYVLREAGEHPRFGFNPGNPMFNQPFAQQQQYFQGGLPFVGGASSGGTPPASTFQLPEKYQIVPGSLPRNSFQVEGGGRSPEALGLGGFGLALPKMSTGKRENHP